MSFSNGSRKHALILTSSELLGSVPAPDALPTTLLSAIAGFPLGVIELESVQPDLLRSACNAIIDRLKGKQVLPPEGVSEASVHCLEYIYRGATKEAVEALEGPLETYTALSPEIRAVIAECWRSKAGSVLQDPKKVLSRSLEVGKLVGLSWKIGVALQSSTCKDLNEPFVCLSFKVQDSGNGPIQTHVLELSILEFEDMAAEFRELQQQLGRA